MTPLPGLIERLLRGTGWRRLVWLPAVLLTGCLQPPVPEAPQEGPEPRMWVPEAHGQLINFGDPGLARLAARLRDGSQQIHILQLGDSHTAADFFTGALRDAFQQHYGNAGPGWLPPAWIRGQRSATLRPGDADSTAWQLTSSRLQEHADFPLGGFVLQPLASDSRIQLQPYNPDPQRYDWRVLYQSSREVQVQVNGAPQYWPATTGWQWSAAARSELPLELTTGDDGYPWLGGWWLETGTPGVLLSSLGINGATSSMPWRWGEGWLDSLAALQPDVLILAYGTNEAFNEDLEQDSYYRTLSEQLTALRQQLPHSVFLLVGAPDAIRPAQADRCPQNRPDGLDRVQAVQRHVANEHQLLYWDWQAMMGGSCSITQWQEQNLARPDGVHLTRAGYEASAQALFKDLHSFLQEQD